jgi:hypothetical protein
MNVVMKNLTEVPSRFKDDKLRLGYSTTLVEHRTAKS